MGSHGFTEVTRLAAARRELLGAVDPPASPETVPVAAVEGRALAEAVAATRDVPGFERAAMDGYAVRAEDTHGASDRSPAVLDIVEAESGGSIGPGQASSVHTGSPIPDGADAVVKVERTAERENATDERADTVEVFAAVPPGNDVAPAGEDVRAGDRLFDAGRRLRPSDLGLLKAAGHRTVPVAPRPTVSVIPTGEELVDFGPGRGETTETNGLTVSRLAERWGADVTCREIVGDDVGALADAMSRDTDRDLVVTTGGSSVGERDLIQDVVGDLGEVLTHGLALQPGQPAGFGVVDDTPVLTLPGYPVSCLVTAVQLLRPAVARAGGFDAEPLPTVEAELDRKIASEVGRRSFVRVRFSTGEDDGSGSTEGDRPTVEPVPGGAGVLSSVAGADGWVAIPESREGVPAGETVSVERWEWFY